MFMNFFMENLATKADRYGLGKLGVNGCVCFSVFEEFIFISVSRD